LRGLGYPTLGVNELEASDRVLTEGRRLERARHYAVPGFAIQDITVRDLPASDEPERRVYVCSMAGGGVSCEIHVIGADDMPPARDGPGSVHRVASRVPDHDVHQVWQAHMTAIGYHNSGMVGRHWFESFYVREPKGILFALATHRPFGAIDEDEGTLGERLALPPSREPRRAEIEPRLRPLRSTQAG